MVTTGCGMLVVLLLCLSVSVSAELNLDDNKNLIHWEEDPLQVFNDRFSYDNALYRLDQINGYLDSFRALTEMSRSQLSEEELQGIGNTGRDVQSLGFHNIPLTVEGALRKQHYQLAQLEYELAQYKFEDDEITGDELNMKRDAFEQAEADFQEFWDSFTILD